MAKRKRLISTNNKEIYEKLNMLNFTSDVILKDVKKTQITQIIRNINKKGRILNMENLGNYILVKKVNPINFRMYLR